VENTTTMGCNARKSTKQNKTIIFPLVLYGCETWLLTLREERRMRLFKKGVLRKIFGFKRDVVSEEWRRLRNEELD
jgi:hypothetical protein